MLKTWGPLAAQSGEEISLENRLKAGLFTLKVIEQIMRLDGAETEPEGEEKPFAAPEELARRLEEIERLELPH